MSSKPKKTKSKKEKPSKPKGKKEAETGEADDASLMTTQDEVVGSLATDADDGKERAEKPKRSKRKRDEDKGEDERETSAVGAPEAPQSEMREPVEFGVEVEVKQEPLRLPRGAFLALRKSGGLHFTTREVVVYPDGRAAYDARGVPQKEYNRLRRVLNDAQVLGLRKLLDQSNFWKSESTGEQNPDGYAYEIAARLGQRSNEIELFDGSVPENMTGLVERLSKLLPDEE